MNDKKRRQSDFKLLHFPQHIDEANRLFRIRLVFDGASQRKDEAKDGREHVDICDPDIPYRVDTARGRHVTPNIGRKPKLITTASILLEMLSVPHLSELRGMASCTNSPLPTSMWSAFRSLDDANRFLSYLLRFVSRSSRLLRSGNSVSEQPHQGDLRSYGPRRGVRVKRGRRPRRSNEEQRFVRFGQAELAF